MGFVWDVRKDKANFAKHGVRFDQAVHIFADPVLGRIDGRRDYGEIRYRALGAYDGEVLLVAYTLRSGDVRIISARKASRNERKEYQKAFGSPRQT